MRRLILAAAAPLLLAQGAHYEGGVLIAPTTVEAPIRLRNHPEPIPTLAFIEPDGRSHRLELPPELDGRLGRCIQITHHQGITYAVGFAHLPLPPGKAGNEAMKQAYFQQPRRLYACDPSGRWTLLAGLESDTSHRAWMLLPLGGGRFLFGNPAFCWQGDAASPFGIYRVGGGRLQLERLVDLGLGGPWYRAVPLPAGSEEAKRYGRGPQVTETYREVQGHADRWQVLRLSAGLCFLHRTSRRWFLLDDQVSRCLAQGRFGGAEPEELLAAAVRPDGRVLVAIRPGSSSENFKAWIDQNSVFDRQGVTATPGEALLLGRAEALRPPMFQKSSLIASWRILDPTTGAIWDTPPPAHVTLQGLPFRLAPLNLQVQPDGNLRVLQDQWPFRRASRLRYDWLDRLLKPFTHDWRKMEP